MNNNPLSDTQKLIRLNRLQMILNAISDISIWMILNPIDLFNPETTTLSLYLSISLLLSTTYLIQYVLPLNYGLTTNIYPITPPISFIRSWILGTLQFHLVAVIYGAPVFTGMINTFAFVTVMSTYIILPIAVAKSSSQVSLRMGRDFLLGIGLDNKPRLSILWIPTWATLFGAWISAIPIPLDWDRPWQEWPIPCVLGAAVGHCLGCIISFLYSYYSEYDRYQMKQK